MRRGALVRVSMGPEKRVRPQIDPALWRSGRYLGEKKGGNPPFVVVRQVQSARELDSLHLAPGLFRKPLPDPVGDFPKRPQGRRVADLDEQGPAPEPPDACPPGEGGPDDLLPHQSQPAHMNRVPQPLGAEAFPDQLADGPRLTHHGSPPESSLKTCFLLRRRAMETNRAEPPKRITTPMAIMTHAAGVMFWTRSMVSSPSSTAFRSPGERSYRARLCRNARPSS
jgi:hypothetical protein